VAIDEDTNTQEQTANINEERISIDGVGLAKEFVDKEMKVWTPDDGAPCSRGPINLAFLNYTKGLIGDHRSPNSQEMLVSTGVLQNSDGPKRFVKKFKGMNYAVYKRGQDIMTLKLKSVTSE
jgi:hypothetical protein